MRIVTPTHLYGYRDPLIRPAGIPGETSGTSFLLFAGAALGLAYAFYRLAPPLRLPGSRSAIMPPAPRRRKRR